MISFNGHKLIIDGHEHTLVHEIYEAFETPEGVIVVFKWSKGDPNRNVIMLGADGTFRWQIEKLSNHPQATWQPYTGVSYRDGVLKAYNGDGVSCVLDPETGKIVDRKMVK
jgi:hypothetical protein